MNTPWPTLLLNPLFVVFILIFSITSHASDSEYAQWLKQTQGEFQNYLDENDKAFISFLNQTWEEVDVEDAKIRDPKPKPVNIPVAQPIIIEKPQITVIPPIIVPAIEKPDVEIPTTETPTIAVPVIKPPVMKAPIIETPVIIDRPVVKKDHNSRTISYDFFGESISVNYNKNFKQSFRSKISNKSIADFWTELATQPHKEIIEQLSQRAESLKLNDWGTALLFDQFSRELQGSNQYNQSSRQLTSWFLLVKAGFNARIAYNDQIFLLMPSKQELFATTFFTFNGQRFYSVALNEKSMKPGKVYTYNGESLDGQKDLDFSQPNNFLTSKNQTERTLSFAYNNEQHDIKVHYPRDMVNYFNTFPQLDIKNYFEAGMPSQTAYELLSQLKPIIQGHTETEAVNRLLRFVQTAFTYETDDEQFKQENYLFPLETLHYPASDCEDRAAIFAWLTKSLLNLDVVILDFPGHIAAAVAFNQTAPGDNWKLNGRQYTVTDPTYINANVGMTMPMFKNITPKLITF